MQLVILEHQRQGEKLPYENEHSNPAHESASQYSSEVGRPADDPANSTSTSLSIFGSRLLTGLILTSCECSKSIAESPDSFDPIEPRDSLLMSVVKFSSDIFKLVSQLYLPQQYTVT